MLKRAWRGRACSVRVVADVEGGGTESIGGLEIHGTGSNQSVCLTKS